MQNFLKTEEEKYYITDNAPLMGEFAWSEQNTMHMWWQKT